jgi:hypothetical protein
VQTLIRLKSDEASPTLVCVRENGQTSLIRIPGVDSVCSIRHVPSTERSGLALVHDFTAVHVSPLESVLFLAHGTGNHGSLTRVQEAAELTTGDAVAIEQQVGKGCPGSGSATVTINLSVGAVHCLRCERCGSTAASFAAVALDNEMNER